MESNQYAATPPTDGVYREAVERVRDALERAGKTDLIEPAAAVLATTGADGWPSARTVLLKGLDESGAVFYTNRQSRKARQLAENPRAALCFFWQPLGEQVEIRGVVAPVSDGEADRYWASRPRLSQIGGWASRQSEPLAVREQLDSRVAEVEAAFPNEVPRPAHWSGYRIIPYSVELWKAGDGRLHDRERYEFAPAGWTHTLLNP